MTIHYRHTIEDQIISDETQETTSPKDKQMEYVADVDLTEQDQFYLIRQYVENRREEIGLSLEKIVELRELEAIIREYEEELEAIPKNLGIPSIIDKFRAAIEAVRTNRKEEHGYDGGDDLADEGEFGIDQSYIELFTQAWLNPKTIRLLSPQRKPVKCRQRKLTPFDLFDKSDLAEIYRRCKALTLSPIYDKMRTVGEEHYRLQHEIELRFTEQMGFFLIPIREFSDIPRKGNFDLNGELAFIKAGFQLPPEAYIRKYSYRKGGTIEELSKFVQRLGGEFSEKQIEYLEELSNKGILRLYRELCEREDHDLLRSYFVNIRRGYKSLNKGQLVHMMIRHLSNEGKIVTKRVIPQVEQFPDWMHKAGGGFLIEGKQGKPVPFSKPLQLAMDRKLPAYAFRFEKSFLPSYNLNACPGTWREKYLEEMRLSYQRNPRIFKKYAADFAQGKAELKCACANGHVERCPVPVLEEILRQVAENL